MGLQEPLLLLLEGSAEVCIQQLGTSAQFRAMRPYSFHWLCVLGGTLNGGYFTGILACGEPVWICHFVVAGVLSSVSMGSAECEDCYCTSEIPELTFMTPCWMSGDGWLTRTMRASGWMSLSITSSSMRSGNSSKMPLRSSYRPQQISTRQSSVLERRHTELLSGLFLH